MELVLEIVSEPWTPPPFNLVIDLWVILGRPAGPQWPRFHAGKLQTIKNREISADIRRWERAKAAMEQVRKVILKDLDDNQPSIFGVREQGTDHDVTGFY
jgi:hypothetical protein